MTDETARAAAVRAHGEAFAVLTMMLHGTEATAAVASLQLDPAALHRLAAALALQTVGALEAFHGPQEALRRIQTAALAINRPETGCD